MWVIVRYESSSEYSFLTNKKQGSKSFFISESEDIFRDNAINFTHILTLLLPEGIYVNCLETFVFADIEYYDFTSRKDTKLSKAIFSFCVYNMSDTCISTTDKFEDFSSIVDCLILFSDKLDNMLNNETAPKLMYIGGLLKMINVLSVESRLQFVTLVSILELMLTHNPDYNRFNIEDSISKQFRLKTSIVVYLSDKSKDLNVIKKNLKEIYNQRSNITHGNFQTFNNYLQKDKETNSDFYMGNFYSLMNELLTYNKIVISSYIEDSSFIDFLKAN
jgi:hypothetical protein